MSAPSQAAPASAALRSQIAAAMPGIPFSFEEALWSDPLELVPGAFPASPSAGKGNTALLQAAAFGGIADHASLVAGRWPAAPGGRPYPPPGLLRRRRCFMFPRARYCGCAIGSLTLVNLDITGVFVPRQGAGAADSYWKLNYIPASGKSASYGSTTYGPLAVSRAALGPALTVFSGLWVAQPDMAAFREEDLKPVSASVAALAQSRPRSRTSHACSSRTSQRENWTARLPTPSSPRSRRPTPN